MVVKGTFALPRAQQLIIGISCTPQDMIQEVVGCMLVLGCVTESRKTSLLGLKR